MSEKIDGMERRDGFVNQRLVVVPQPLVEAALVAPVTRRLLVTDAGSFPAAEGHRRERPEGSAEAIVIVCTAGEGWVETAGQRHRVGPGTAVLLAPGTPHAYGTSDRPWTIWWCHVRGTDLADLAEVAGVDALHPVISLRGVDRVVASMDEIVTALERDQSPARLLAVSGMAWRLLTQLAVDRRLPEQGEPLERAMNYLAERIDGQITVPELAALVGISPSHLSALFRHATGGGVTAHHTALRMARARSLLDTTEQPIAEVGRAVGYADQFYFSRQFRQAHGVSPTTYRAQRKG
ncbi:helix-turn-helix domain-containing protein [Agromyces atrinae]|uniref:helix-turn-helix domain-containing protein n=1 Tax=Agromyces atrinae TaxID=592376 RepID=UPI001F596F2A|nr:helix-turn-helix domain-containing protein [Agromyces atrinae]MCI2957662.1 helix-turn-helix domain-containing protein [Agromyces atrinae]